MRTMILMVAACGGSAPAIRNETPRAPAPAKLAPCPKPEVTTPLVAKAWGAGGKAEVCVPFQRAGKTMYWLEGAADPPPDTMSSVPTKNAMLDEHHALVWHHDQASMGFGFMYMGGAEAADLDGDGNDEVLYERTTGEGGFSVNQLVVVYFEPDPVVLTASVGWMGDAGEKECTGIWTVVPGVGNTKRIAVERKGNACKDDERTATYDRKNLEKVVEE